MANRNDWIAEQRAITARKLETDHGTDTNYTRGCRCRPCRDAHSQSRRLLSGEKTAYLRALKAERQCADCDGFFGTSDLHFDHRDPSTKRFNLAAAAFHGWKAIKEEVAKCDVVCRECHSTRTREQNLAPQWREVVDVAAFTGSA